MAHEPSTLIAFGGLPGAGKSTLARLLSDRIGALYLRIDTIEQRIRDSGMEAAARKAIAAGLHANVEIGAAGYLAAYGIAADNLSHGRTVIADSVNPIAITREAWRSVASNAEARLIEVEVVCSDEEEHRRRVESRTVTVPGLRPPSWQAVMDREYDPWPEAHRLDTAGTSIRECLERLSSLVAGATNVRS